MSMLSLNFTQGRPWDRAGMAVSLACVAHCTGTFFLAAALPVLGATESETHAGFALAVLLLGMLAFIPGYRRHRRKGIIVLAAGGFAMLSAGVVLLEGTLSAELETGLTALGGITLITAHLHNAYFCHICPVCQEEPCVGK